MRYYNLLVTIKSKKEFKKPISYNLINNIFIVYIKKNKLTSKNNLFLIVVAFFNL